MLDAEGPRKVVSPDKKTDPRIAYLGQCFFVDLTQARVSLKPDEAVFESDLVRTVLRRPGKEVPYEKRLSCRLSDKGRLKAKQFTDQILTKYLEKYSYQEIMAGLRECYTYSVSRTVDADENKQQNEIFRLLLASVRARIPLNARWDTLPEAGDEVKQDHQEQFKKITLPKKIAKGVARVLLGFVVTASSGYLGAKGASLMGDPGATELVMGIEAGAEYATRFGAGLFQPVEAFAASDEVKNQITNGETVVLVSQQNSNWLLDYPAEEINEGIVASSTPATQPSLVEIEGEPTVQVTQQAIEASPTILPEYTEEPTELATQIEPTYTATATLTNTPVPTQTPQPTSQPTNLPNDLPTEAPTQESTPAPAEFTQNVDSLIEWALGGEFYNSVVEARQLRLGQRSWLTPPEGFTEVQQLADSSYQTVSSGQENAGGYTFFVPEGLEEEYYFLYQRDSLAQSLGIFNLPESERAAALERQVNSGRINILLAGLDYRPEFSGVDGGFRGRSDSLMLVSINIQTGEISLISIGRDTPSPEVAHYFGGSKSNQEISVMSWAHQSDDGRLSNTDIAFSRFVVENACGCIVDGVYQMNFAVVSGLIDEIYPEGMPIYVPVAIDDPRSFETLGGAELHIEEGMHLMNGDLAVAYAQSRKTSAQGDLSRQERQRAIFEAIIRGVMSQFKDKVEAGDVSGAILILQRFFTVSQNSLQQSESNRILLDSGATEAQENVAYTRTLGLGPITFFEHFNNLSQEILEPENMSAVTQLVFSPRGLEFINSYTSGEALNTMQISRLDTNRSAYSSGLYIDYWAPSRDRINSLFETGIDPVVAAEQEAATRLVISSDVTIADWISDERGPFAGQVELSYAQQMVIYNFVSSFGRLSVGADVTDRLPQFQAGLLLVKVGFSENGENEITQDYNQFMYASETTFPERWLSYFEQVMESTDPQLSEMQALLTNAIDPDYQLSSIEVTQIEEDFLRFGQ